MGLRSASGRLRFPTVRAVPRLVAGGVVVGLLPGAGRGGLAGRLLLAADRVDPVAAGLAVAALVATGLLLRHRSRRGERHAVLVLGSGATIAALLVALSLPVYRSRPDPLVVNVGASAAQPRNGPPTTTGPVGAPTGPPGAAPSPSGGTEVLGFAASDYDDTAAGID